MIETLLEKAAKYSDIGKEKHATFLEDEVLIHGLRKNMENFIHASRGKSVDEFLKFKNEIHPLIQNVINKLSSERWDQLNKEWRQVIFRAQPKLGMQRILKQEIASSAGMPSRSLIMDRQPAQYEGSRLDGGKIKAQYSKYATAPEKHGKECPCSECKKKYTEKKAEHFVEQHHPAKVKEIYQALEEEHPEYSAGKKARIANSTYNKMHKKAANQRTTPGFTNAVGAKRTQPGYLGISAKKIASFNEELKDLLTNQQ